MEEEMKLACDNCHCEKFHCLVSYGSYYLKCSNCHNPGPATSFYALMYELKGDYEIIEVDSNMNELRRLTIGKIQDYVEIISKEANEGKIFWLKNIEQT
jgi:hypothetical protein